MASLAVGAPAFGEQQNDDTSMFLAGFKLYQQKDYVGSLAALKAVVEKYPETQLRDLALYWLSRSYYRNGNLQEAARSFSQFAKEFPKSPLKGLVDSEMANLVARYERGEKLPTHVVASTSTSG
jgi:TolA-binding protein